MASSVELEPAPAITGTRPLASSTQISITRSCSSWLRVGDLPVVPQGTSPWVPSAICQATRARNAASSTLPFLNGRDQGGDGAFDAVADAGHGRLGFCFAAGHIVARL